MKLASVEGIHLHDRSNRDVKSLEIIDSIFHFTNDIFKHLPSLKKIAIKNGGMSTLEPKMQSSSVTYLEVEGNKIREVPDEIFVGLPNLDSLQLNNNEIEQINQFAFSGLSKLKELSLKDNKISQLPVEVFKDLVELTHLSLKRNKLRALDGNLLKHNLKVEIVKFENNNELKFIGESLLDFSKHLRIAGFAETCVGDFVLVDQIRQKIKTNCG